MKCKILNLFIILFASNISYGQYSKIADGDTVRLINSKVFDFIETNLDSLNTENFKIFKSGRDKIVYYALFADSSLEKMFHYLIEEKRPFLDLLKNSKIDSSFKKWKNSKTVLQFISNRKGRCQRRLDLSIFPLVRSNSHIYLNILALSPGYQDVTKTDC